MTTLGTKGNEGADNYLTMTTKAIKSEQERHKYESEEFKEYFERRRMLERLISKIYSTKDGNPYGKGCKGDAGGDTVKLIAKMQEEEIMRLQQRYCRSFRELDL